MEQYLKSDSKDTIIMNIVTKSYGINISYTKTLYSYELFAVCREVAASEGKRARPVLGWFLKLLDIEEFSHPHFIEANCEPEDHSESPPGRSRNSIRAIQSSLDHDPVCCKCWIR